MDVAKYWLKKGKILPIPRFCAASNIYDGQIWSKVPSYRFCEKKNHSVESTILLIVAYELRGSSYIYIPIARDRVFLSLIFHECSISPSRKCSIDVVYKKVYKKPLMQHVEF
jgi:hypothetical protein